MAGRAPAQIVRRRAWPLRVILAILCALFAATRGQTAPPQILLEKALENARAITNIEIQYDDMMWMKGVPLSAEASNHWTKTMKTSYPYSKDYTRISHITYTAAGEKYRIASSSESSRSTNIINFFQTTFDGKLWAEFNGSSGNMAEQDGDMPGEKLFPCCPLIAPFFFLAKDSDDSSPCWLRFTDLRSPDILNGLILPEAETSNGVQHLSFPGLPRNGVNQLWNLTLDAAAADFLPRSIENITYAGTNRFGVRDPGCDIVYTLSGYTNLGAFHFPTKITWNFFVGSTNHLRATTPSMTGMITVVSVKLPTQIPDSTFRPDESKASRIFVADEFKGYGVGLVLGEAGSNIVVKRILADSPAGRQTELQPGDRILSIAKSNSPGITVHAGKAGLPRATALLQGAKGSAVRITFVPAGKEDSAAQVITLVRGEAKGRVPGAGGRLTNGMKAPDMEMVTLTKHATEHLSDYAGKIVILEFWASWCPPCRKSMADLQLAAARNPHWKDKVVVIAASVDDTADLAAKCIEEKGWHQTHNVWLGDKAIKTYRVGAIPNAYVIDAKGNIIVSGIPAADRPGIPDLVDQQLDAAAMKSKKDSK